MKNYFIEIETKLGKKLKFEKIDIVDNSQKHKRHKFFSKDRYHLHLKINSSYLK